METEPGRRFADWAATSVLISSKAVTAATAETRIRLSRHSIFAPCAVRGVWSTSSALRRPLSWSLPLGSFWCYESRPCFDRRDENQNRPLGVPRRCRLPSCRRLRRLARWRQRGEPLMNRGDFRGHQDCRSFQSESLLRRVAAEVSVRRLTLKRWMRRHRQQRHVTLDHELLEELRLKQPVLGNDQYLRTLDVRRQW